MEELADDHLWAGVLRSDRAHYSPSLLWRPRVHYAEPPQDWPAPLTWVVSPDVV